MTGAMAFEELKAKQSVMWGNGPYERVSEHLKIAHDHLFRAVPPQRRRALARRGHRHR